MSRIAQVEMRVEVDDADLRRRLPSGEMLGQAGPAAEGHLMAATEHQRQVPRLQQRTDATRQARLGGGQVAVLADHVAGVEGRRFTVPGQVGQSLAQGQRPAGGADATMIASHALVAGEAEQGQAWLAGLGQRLDALVPARAVRLGVGTTAPGSHAVTISEHE